MIFQQFPLKTWHCFLVLTHRLFSPSPLVREGACAEFISPSPLVREGACAEFISPSHLVGEGAHREDEG